MYTLGVDLGTTFTAAAVWRDGRAEISPLGMRTAAIPSVVLARADGSFLTGEAAARRASMEPGRVAREFKRRLGDSTPLLLGGSPFSAESLTARLLASVVSAVSDREGGLPRSACICHPANWGPFKTDLLRQAVRLADLAMPVSFTTEPEAAAVSYARQERLSPGDTVAVYDLGGGTFDAAVLRRTARGFEILGQPEGIERLGGIDIDAAVFDHVVRSVGAPMAELDEDDPVAVSAVARLRAECTEAKEALSSDTDVTIPVLLPTVTTEVRLTRAELEDMVRPSLYDSIESLKRALRSAAVEPADLSAVLLVGGSSRMPLVSQIVGSELGIPVAVDAHPKHSIALGAAWTASGAALPAEPDAAPATVVVPTSPRPAPEPPPPARQQPMQQQPVQQQRLQQPVQRVQQPAQPQQPAQQQQQPRRPSDGVQVLRPAGPLPSGYQQPPAGPPVRDRPTAYPQPTTPLPYDPSPQPFADPRQEAAPRFTPVTPRRSVGRRPLLVGGLAGLGALFVVLSVWTALKWTNHSQDVSDPRAGAPSVTSGNGADVAPTSAPGGKLEVNVQVGAGGHVRSDDGTIDCPDTCRTTITGTRTLTLHASASGFLGWAGCQQPDYLACTVGGGRTGTISPVARYGGSQAGQQNQGSSQGGNGGNQGATTRQQTSASAPTVGTTTPPTTSTTRPTTTTGPTSAPTGGTGGPTGGTGGNSGGGTGGSGASGGSTGGGGTGGGTGGATGGTGGASDGTGGGAGTGGGTGAGTGGARGGGAQLPPSGATPS